MTTIETRSEPTTALRRAPQTPSMQSMYAAIFPSDRKDDDGNPIEEQALMRITANGAIRTVRKMVQLDPEKGHIFKFGQWNAAEKKMVDNIGVSSLGYDYLNLYAGIRIIQPRTLIDEQGKEVCNPFPYRDAHGFTQALKVNMVGVGRFPNGNWAVRDVTINYDLGTYFAQDVFAKWKGKSNEKPKEWGRMVSFIDEETKADPTKKVVPIPGGSFLVMDLTHGEAIKLQGEHINRSKFIERIAVSVCSRNVLKKFLAVSKLGKDLRVPIVGWVDVDRDEMQLAKIIQAARDGATHHEGEPVDFDSSPIDVDPREETEAAMAGDVDEDSATGDADGGDDGGEDQAEGVDVPDFALTPEQDQECKRARAAIRALHAKLPPSVAAGILKSCNCQSMAQIADIQDPLQLGAIESELSAAIDAARKGSGTDNKGGRKAKGGKDGEGQGTLI